jgi:UDPglucose 6-dehydrogenase
LLPTIDFAESALEAVDGADAVVLVTEWPQFRELDWGEVAARMAGTTVIDGRNALDPDTVLAAGLGYEAVGRAQYTAAGAPRRAAPVSVA